MAMSAGKFIAVAVFLVPLAVATPLDDFVYSDESLSQFEFQPMPEYDMEGTYIFDSDVSWYGHVLNVTSGLWLTG